MSLLNLTSGTTNIANLLNSLYLVLIYKPNLLHETTAVFLLLMPTAFVFVITASRYNYYYYYLYSSICWLQSVTEMKLCESTSVFQKPPCQATGPQKYLPLLGEKESFFSWVRRHSKWLLFLPIPETSAEVCFACIIHPDSVNTLVYWLKTVRVRTHPLIFLPLSYAAPLPFHSQAINLPVIGEMHWHLSIKWHLIYALFMPHLCAQVLQLFIKCPLLCQNMEIERRYSWYSRQTHQWTGSHWGPPLTVTRKSYPVETVWQGEPLLSEPLTTRGTLQHMMQCGKTQMSSSSSVMKVFFFTFWNPRSIFLAALRVCVCIHRHIMHYS